MNIAQIEEKIGILITSYDKEKFIFDFLLTYGLPKASITRLKKGNLNLSKETNEISWKQKLYFREENDKDLHVTLSEIESNLSHKQRFVIVTDYETWLAADTKTGDKLDIPFKDLPQYYDFFLPWAGMEKTQHQNENPADVKAAEKMAKLFDEIKKDNPQDDPAFIKDLNVFLSRLLFCFFAEDTNIFGDNQFTNALASHTKVDGSDLNSFFDEIFEVLNTHKRKRIKLAAYLDAFPYVNGGLFEQSILAPNFTRKSRQAIIAAGELNWKDINPDIFGSMFQAVIGVEQRGSLGQHYTSVPNIMKVIEPLFLNDLYEEYEKAGDSSKKLNALLNRIASLKIFDPACGSGNFLIIAYKELRRLEILIFQKLNIGIPFSAISLTQFYGIEIDSFAVEIAQLSLWLAEHQMNVEFFQAFGKTNPTLPLKQAGHIVCANACRIDWEEVCPKNDDQEIYILGNPPFIGSKEQNEVQKSDLELVMYFNSKCKKLDYVSCWFVLANNHINAYSKFAFVSTNSICQGEQVQILWPYLLINSRIFFAYQSFHWKNNAKDKAGVTCVIMGLSKRELDCNLYIHHKNKKVLASNISPYILNMKDIIIYPRRTPLSSIPAMIRGSQPTDDGNLIMSEEERKNAIRNNPESANYIRRYVGGNDFINSKIRYCLWINDSNKLEALRIPIIKERVEKVKAFRLKSKKKATQKKALVAYRFDEIKHEDSESIIFPIISSHRREYVPIGFLNKETIISNKGQVVYNANPWIYSLLTSRMHMTWMKTTSSRMRKDYQYSNTLSYNTFPFPPISKVKKEELTTHTFRILEEREQHPEKTLAQLYDPDKMPEGLREAHRLNDLAVERCYRSKPFESDEERLEYLFKLYEKMIQEEKDRETLFQKEKKTRKKRK